MGVHALRLGSEPFRGIVVLAISSPVLASWLWTGCSAIFWIPRSLSAVQMSERDRCYIERSAVNDDACTSYSKVSRCDSRHDSKGGMLRVLSSQIGLAQMAG